MNLSKEQLEVLVQEYKNGSFEPFLRAQMEDQRRIEFDTVLPATIKATGLSKAQLINLAQKHELGALAIVSIAMFWSEYFEKIRKDATLFNESLFDKMLDLKAAHPTIYSHRAIDAAFEMNKIGNTKAYDTDLNSRRIQKQRILNRAIKRAQKKQEC